MTLISGAAGSLKLALLIPVVTQSIIAAQEPVRSVPARVSVTAIDSACRRVFEAHGLAGFQVAILWGDSVLYQGAFGAADLETATPVDTNTRFPSASLGKAFTSAALLSLVDDGRIELGAPIQQYLPGFPRKAGGDITPRLLAIHQSGIRHYRDGERTPSFYARHFDDAAEALVLFAHDSLVVAPGSGYAYSSYGYNLPAAIQAAPGIPFQRYVQERIFGPLRLAHTSFDDVRRVQQGRARLYSHADPFAERAAREDSLYRVPTSWDHSYNAGGGNLLTTADDLVRFGAGFFSSGLLSERSLALAQTPQPIAGGEPTQASFGWFVLQREVARLRAAPGP
jgi:serine beta-lactamase-like protein LACTB, mitochondrial